MIHDRERPLCGKDIVGDLRRVDLEGEPHPLLVEDIEDRVPSLCEVPEALVDLLLRGRGKEVELVPDRRAGEARHRVNTETRGGPRRLLHLLGGAAADALWLSIPQTRSGTVARCRSSIGSQTAWPTRWLPTA